MENEYIWIIKRLDLEDWDSSTICGVYTSQDLAEKARYIYKRKMKMNRKKHKCYSNHKWIIEKEKVNVMPCIKE